MTGSSIAPRNHLSWIARLVPAIGWLRTYQRGWFRADVIAGVTLAAYLIPASIGDASLANLPPSSGLYACIFSGLVFWLFTSSMRTSVTITSAIALLVGSSLGTIAGGDTERYATLAAGTAVMVAALALLARLVRAGGIVNFISETVLIGFKTGVALYLASTQLPKLCGFKGSHGAFWERSVYFIRNAHETHPAALVVGASALGILLLGKKFLPNKPVGLLVVLGSLALGATVNLGEMGVQMLGKVPQGLPHFGMSGLMWSDVNTLLPLALACFLLGAVETAAIGRMFAQKYGSRLDSDQEFLALAGANLAAGLGQGFPTSGGMSQSLVNEEAGARTPLSGFLAAVLMLLITVYLSGMLQYLPQPVLAAIVLVAITGLFNLSEFKRIWRFSRGEFAVAIAALCGVLGSGLLMGVLIGAILSLLLMLRSSAHPHTTELGRVPGVDYFADLIRHPVNQRVPGVFVFRCDGGLLYYNVEYVKNCFFDLLSLRDNDVKLAVFFLGTVSVLDYSGAELLSDLQVALKKRGIEFRLAEAHSGIRESLRHAGFEKSYGPIEPDQTVCTVLEREGYLSD